MRFYVVALAVVVLDQITKFLVRTYIPLGQSIPKDSLVRLTHVTNTGAAFGLFQGQAALFLWLGIVTMAVVLLLLFYRSPTFGNPWARLALGLELGGGVGNLIDRVRWGQVVDFVDVGFWPVFNVADSSISVGVVVLAAYLFLSGRKPA
ncbi:MAG: signal peptidase II [Chloroflexi bacterium]|nr:signal peptidase II [Chloroflexota bacterium]